MPFFRTGYSLLGPSSRHLEFWLLWLVSGSSPSAAGQKAWNLPATSLSVSPLEHGATINRFKKCRQEKVVGAIGVLIFALLSLQASM